MNHSRSPLLSLLVVIGVFVLALIAFRVVAASALRSWERQVSQRYFIEYLAVAAITLFALLSTRKSLVHYGISFRPLTYHLKAVATGFIPVFAITVGLFYLEEREWTGAVLLSALVALALIGTAWLFRNVPTRDTARVTLAAFLTTRLVATPAFTDSVGTLLSEFVYWFVVVALSEELLFRGYIQSRLNQAFGRPYRFFGVSWGWGVLITSVLFGLWHVVNLVNPLLGTFELSWPWGLWTFFAGLLFGFIREKTDSIAAPTILHGMLNFPPGAMVSLLLSA